MLVPMTDPSAGPSPIPAKNIPAAFASSFAEPVACRRRACIPHLVAAAAAAAPDSIALAYSGTGKSIRYGELNARADGLAAYLISLGIGHESLVAICLDRSFEYVIAALAAWRAGASVPADRCRRGRRRGWKRSSRIPARQVLIARADRRSRQASAPDRCGARRGAVFAPGTGLKFEPARG